MNNVVNSANTDLFCQAKGAPTPTLETNKRTTLSNIGKTFYGYSTFLETYRGVGFRLNRAVKSFQLPISKVQLLYFFYTYDLLLQLFKVRFDMSFAAFMICSMFQYL